MTTTLWENDEILPCTKTFIHLLKSSTLIDKAQDVIFSEFVHPLANIILQWIGITFNHSQSGFRVTNDLHNFVLISTTLWTQTISWINFRKFRGFSIHHVLIKIDFTRTLFGIINRTIDRQGTNQTCKFSNNWFAET